MDKKSKVSKNYRITRAIAKFKDGERVTLNKNVTTYNIEAYRNFLKEDLEDEYSKEVSSIILTYDEIPVDENNIKSNH